MVITWSNSFLVWRKESFKEKNWCIGTKTGNQRPKRIETKAKVSGKLFDSLTWGWKFYSLLINIKWVCNLWWFVHLKTKKEANMFGVILNPNHLTKRVHNGMTPKYKKEVMGSNLSHDSTVYTLFTWDFYTVLILYIHCTFGFKYCSVLFIFI